MSQETCIPTGKLSLLQLINTDTLRVSILLRKPMNVIETINEKVQTTLQSLFTISPELLKKTQVTINTDKQKQDFGDLSSNAALILAKELGENPCAVAEKIVAELKHPSIARVAIAGPGFLNIFLSEEAFKKLAQELYEQRFLFFSSSRYEKILLC